jgi:large subunit ribosomal protein L22
MVGTLADALKALTILRYSTKEASRRMGKLVQSAINNWEQKNELSPDDYELYIKEVMVDSGRMLKRYRPAPHGRAHRIRKRSNHITVVIDSKVPVENLVEEAAEVNDTNEENEN